MANAKATLMRSKFYYCKALVLQKLGCFCNKHSASATIKSMDLALHAAKCAGVELSDEMMQNIVREREKMKEVL